MANEQWRGAITPLRSWWYDLERDWKGVVVGAVIITLSFVPGLLL